jgi:hypothetical protein
MGLQTSGQISIQQIANEKENVSLPLAKENISLRGLSKDSVDDYTRSGSTAIDIAVNADSVASSAHGGPDGGTSDGGHKVSEFYGYDQDFSATSFNNTGAGSVSSFTTNTSTSVNVSSGFLSNGTGLDLDTSTFRSALFWEMNNNHSRGNSPAAQSNSTAAIRIGNDKTNKRIMILLMKDGDADAAAGAGNNSGYILIPYVGLEDATWTYTYEYDTSTQGYSLANSDIGVFRGNPTGQGTFTTSSTYRDIPSNTGGTYASIPGFTGIALTGESLFYEGSSHAATWIAKVPSSESNIKVSVGKSAFHSGSVSVRVRIKAVSGSDTFTALSNYWSLSLSAQRGFGF